MAHSASDGQNSYCRYPSSHWTIRPASAIDHACCQVAKGTNGGLKHDSLNHLREISPLSPRGHPALRPSIYHASGSGHRNVVVPLSLPCRCSLRGMIEFTSFVLGRAQAPRTRLSLTFEGFVHFIHSHNAPSAEQAWCSMEDNVGSIHCRESAFDRP
jgi:hypothetical protein